MMKKITLLAILILQATFTINAQFENGDFEDITCPLDCNMSIDCASHWFGFPNNEAELTRPIPLDCFAAEPPCEGEFSLLLNGDAVTANPFSGEYDPELHGITCDFYISENSPSGHGRLEIFGTNDLTTIVPLGLSHCIEEENLCQSITVPLYYQTPDFQYLVFRTTDNCTVGGIKSSDKNDTRNDGAIGVLDNLLDCESLKLQTSTPNCDELCFYLDNNPCGLELYGGVIISLDDGTEIGLDVGQQDCIIVTPGETINYSVEYYIGFPNNGPVEFFTRSYTHTQPDDNVTADFVITDDEGNVKTSFCSGEPILFKDIGTNGEDEWFIQICQQNIGDDEATDCINWTSNQPYDPITDTYSWQQGMVPSNLNLLTDVWQYHQSGWNFWAGYQYKVTLAVRNKPCVHWVDHTVTFIVEDCVAQIEGVSVTQIDDCTYCFDAITNITNCVEEVTYSWSFGGDGFSNEQSPCHTFSGNGDFEVNLRIDGYNYDPTTSVPCDWDEHNTVVCVHNCSCGCEVINNGFSLSSDGCSVFAQPNPATTNECTQVVHYRWDWDQFNHDWTEDPDPIFYQYEEGGLKEICLIVAAIVEGQPDNSCYDTVCQQIYLNCGDPFDQNDGYDFGDPRIGNDTQTPQTQLSPNPVNDILNIDFDKEWGNNIKIQILNSSGQVIRNIHHDGTMSRTSNIDVCDWSSGIYHLVMQDELGNIFTGKISKQ